MNTIDLPALDGRIPLGFLAAVGALRLLDATDGSATRSPRLSWDPVAGTAVLHTDRDFDGALEALQDAAAAIAGDALLPGGPPDFPRSTSPADWPHGDPIRMPVLSFREEVENWRERYGRDFVDQWVPAMVTDLALDAKRCVEMSPFAAPSGQQKFSTMFEKTLTHVRKHPDCLRDALMAWRRVDGVTGEYLDHHVLRSAADRPDGKSLEAGVPGATWLALMALPWFPVWSKGTEPLAGGWQSRRRRRPIFVWPLWSAPLDADGVRTVIAHPSLVIAERGRSVPPAVTLRRLRPLSVFLVCAADRRIISDRKFAGVLTPTELALGTTRRIRRG